MDKALGLFGLVCLGLISTVQSDEYFARQSTQKSLYCDGLNPQNSLDIDFVSNGFFFQIFCLIHLNITSIRSDSLVIILY